jgi:hypothetical protein
MKRAAFEEAENSCGEQTSISDMEVIRCTTGYFAPDACPFVPKMLY